MTYLESILRGVVSNDLSQGVVGDVGCCNTHFHNSSSPEPALGVPTSLTCPTPTGRLEFQDLLDGINSQICLQLRRRCLLVQAVFDPRWSCYNMATMVNEVKGYAGSVTGRLAAKWAFYMGVGLPLMQCSHER